MLLFTRVYLSELHFTIINVRQNLSHPLGTAHGGKAGDTRFRPIRLQLELCAGALYWHSTSQSISNRSKIQECGCTGSGLV